MILIQSEDLESLPHLAYYVTSYGLIRTLMMMDINKCFLKLMRLEGVPSFTEQRLWGGS